MKRATRYFCYASLLDPEVRKSVVAPRTFSTLQEFLWYNCSPVCGSPTQKLYGGANGDLLWEDLGHMPHLPGRLLPCPQGRPLLTRVSEGDPQTPKGRAGSVCYESHLSFPWVLVTQDFVCALQASWQVWGLILNVIAPLLLSWCGFSLAIIHGVSFFGGFHILLSIVVQQTICDFDVLTGEGERISFYSTILVSYALGTKMFMWLAFLWYSLYCSGLEPNPHLQGLSVFYILQKTMQTSEKVSNIKARAQRNRGRHNETIYLRLRLGLEPNQTPAWDLNPCGWDSTQPKPMVPGFRT